MELPRYAGFKKVSPGAAKFECKAAASFTAETPFMRFLPKAVGVPFQRTKR